MRNIEQFDRFFGEYLSTLYGAFPVPIDFDTLPPDMHDPTWRTFLELGPSSPDWDDFLTRKGAAIAKRDGLAEETSMRTATASWLFETGYFNAERAKQGRTFAIEYVDENDISTGSSHEKHVVFDTYANARLTPKGLEVLHSVPKSLSGEDAERKSLGDQLTDQLKEVATEGRKQAIGKIVGEIIGSAMKAWTS